MLTSANLLALLRECAARCRFTCCDDRATRSDERGTEAVTVPQQGEREGQYDDQDDQSRTSITRNGPFRSPGWAWPHPVR